MEINLLPFLAEAFSTNKKIYKDIDDLYNIDKIKFIELAKKNEFYNHLMAQEGNVEQEYYFKKVLGLLIAADNSIDLSENILRIIKKGWKYTYTYVENHNLLSISDFLNSFVRKNKGLDNITDDELNSNIVIVHLLSSYLEKQIDKDDDMYRNSITSYMQRIDKYKIDNRINILTLDREKKKQLKDLELKIKKEKKIGFHPSNYRLAANKYEGMLINISKLTKDDSFFSPFEYIFDLEDISLISIVEENYLKSKEIQELIFCYTHLQNTDKEIDFEELKKFLYPAIQIRYLCKEYKKAKRYFFENFNEELYNEILKAENENKSIKRSSLLIQNENERLEVTVDELERENKRLKQELMDNENNKNELIALREFMFSLDKHQEHESNKLIDYDKLKTLKAVFVGGHVNLHSKLKELLPNWTYLSPNNLNFDEKLLINANKIYYYADFNNHSMYYKVTSIINKNNVNLCYIEGNTNIELILKQLYKGL